MNAARFLALSVSLRRYEIDNGPNGTDRPFADEADQLAELAAHLAALDAYQFAEQQEDRYMGSVFVTPQGERDAQARTRAAYDACKALGMTTDHGL